MKQELRFGIGTFQLHSTSWKKEVERWRLIEALRFDSVWLGDHFVNYMHPEEPWFEAWTLLAALANHTSHIRIGPLVTAIAFRNPAFLARQALTVDHISNGRLELGLGTGLSGGRDPSYSMTGIEDWAPSERVARFREVVEIVDQCLRNRVTTYRGHYYQLKDTAMYPPPVQQPRPPITIAAHGPSMLKIAARYANTWNCVIGGKRDEFLDVKLRNTRKRNELINEYCAKIGRDPSTLRRSLLVFEPEEESIFDSTEIFQEVVRRYYDVGITEFIFTYPDTDERIFMLKRIARDVIPKLRAMKPYI
jgi:alkanesulfonate monooxygenase SsuD/methylene tetrahydromethanopterin reductase-like flavin-dependent oxidoreductase (luciferase family)